MSSAENSGDNAENSGAVDDLVAMSISIHALQHGSANNNNTNKSKIVAKLAKKLSFERKQRKSSTANTASAPAPAAEAKTGTIGALARKLSFSRCRSNKASSAAAETSSSSVAGAAHAVSTAEVQVQPVMKLVKKQDFERKPPSRASSNVLPPPEPALPAAEVVSLRAALERETARADAAEREVSRLRALLHARDDAR